MTIFIFQSISTHPLNRQCNVQLKFQLWSRRFLRQQKINKLNTQMLVPFHLIWCQFYTNKFTLPFPLLLLLYRLSCWVSTQTWDELLGNFLWAESYLVKQGSVGRKEGCRYGHLVVQLFLLIHLEDILSLLTFGQI